MLQRIETEVRELRDLFARGPDAKNPARIAGSGVIGVSARKEGIVGEPSIAALHPHSLGDWLQSAQTRRAAAKACRVCPYQGRERRTLDAASGSSATRAFATSSNTPLRGSINSK